jgi:NADPH:quinone reductase-like Zn-dependent oxidoreductase
VWRHANRTDVVVVPEKQVLAKPDSLSHEQAAAIPVNYLTAWQLLVVNFHPLPLMSANKSVFGVNLGHMWHETEMITGWMDTLLKGFADGWVRPHVDKSFSLAQAGEAHTYMEERKNTGKTVLTI